MADETRRPLHERTNSQSNAQAIRLVPSTPPQLLGQRTDPSSLRPTFITDPIYSRTALPTHPSHILGPGKVRNRGPFNNTTPVLDDSFHPPSSSQTLPQSTGSRHNSPQPAHNALPATGSPSTIKPRAPAKKRLQIHKDGRTFSLLRDDSQPADVHSTSPALSPASRTSFESIPSYASNTEPRNSEISASFLADEDSTLTTIPGTPPAEAQDRLDVDPVGSSPWNYSLVGGVRKVPKTPDHKQASLTSSEVSPPPVPLLPSVPEASSESPSLSQSLSAKQSFQSNITVSTASEHSNYKVYRNDAKTNVPELSDVQSAEEPNYQILQESSSETSVVYRPHAAASDSEEWEPSDISRTSSVIRRPVTSDSDANYEIHGDPSPATSSVDISLPVQYSQESLVVPALRPRAHRSHERLGYYKSRSRESLRSRAGSLTSISTVLSQREALKAIVSTGFIVNLPTPRGPNSWAEPSSNYPQRPYMNEHPHQWSSQLSTVLSVSDGASERNSRSWSDATGSRSRGPSRNSRAVYSIGSSSFAQDDPRRLDWPETPQLAYTRNGLRHMSTSSVRMIESQDEYGDGITDLQDLRSRPSRTRMSGYYSIGGSENGRTNTMRSTTSSRSNSLLANSIPTWARLYYGSGERRYLDAPGSSTEGSDSRSNSMRSRSRSPNIDHFPLSLYSPRRRPRDPGPHPGRRVPTGSMEITPVQDHSDRERAFETQYTSRFRTWSMSSVWSPHLRVDRRAMRQSVWEPPSVSWSTEGGYFGRRNVQILMFIVGFIFPFAWMIAAVLPLPHRPLKEMEERDNSTSNLGISNDNYNDYERQFGPLEEARYESAKWWRRLNRGMSLVGALIIAAIIILVVVSLREGW